MIAYCGLDCSICDGYLATRANDKKLLAEVAGRWSKLYNAEVKPEHVICDGCKTGKRQSRHCATSCNIRKCNLEKGFSFFIECSEFPCADEKFILNAEPEAAERMKAI